MDLVVRLRVDLVRSLVRLLGVRPLERWGHRRVVRRQVGLVLWGRFLVVRRQVWVVRLPVVLLQVGLQLVPWLVVLVVRLRVVRLLVLVPRLRRRVAGWRIRCRPSAIRVLHGPLLSFRVIQTLHHLQGRNSRRRWRLLLRGSSRWRGRRRLNSHSMPA